MTVFEMQGVLRGKAIPGDIKVNESLAAYLVRKLVDAEARGVEKFAEQQEKLAADYSKLSPGCYGEKSSAENALMARAFAVELREGRV